MNPSQQPTPAQIHDITGAVWFFPYPTWVLVLIAVGILALFGLILWMVLRKKPHRPLTAREKALQVIASFRNQMEGADPYQFGVTVSEALRGYIREEYKLEATTKTSLEFLESLRRNSVFTDNEKASLAAFLEGTDLLKFARLHAGVDEMSDLLAAAERLVKGEGERAGKGYVK